VGQETTPRGRILAALDRREADRVPLDLGATNVTGIHRVAYDALRKELGAVDQAAEVSDIRLGIAVVGEEIRDALRVDAASVRPGGPAPEVWSLSVRDVGDSYELRDEFGITWQMPRAGGLYFDIVDHPLKGGIGLEAVGRYPWPDPTDPHRFLGMRDAARRIVADEHRAAVFGGMSTGIFELGQRMRGFEQFFMDLLTDVPLAEAILDKALELAHRYWVRVFEEAPGLVDVAYATDDYGSQRGLLISPATWRALIKPRLAALAALIHEKGRARFFLHSCGAIREIIPDLIEVGVDILNPVQVNAPGMDTRELKREFGRELTFWGGGVDTQRTLPCGSPQEVRDEVRRHVEELMPSGGFVFAAVHNIQADVPPRNIIAMLEALGEYGRYGLSDEPTGLTSTGFVR
jgi:uroporphyrinogen decarboxylase